MRVEKVAIYYLQMTDPGQLRPRGSSADGLELRQVELPLPELNRFFYTAVGGDWYWIDLLGWTYQDWLIWVDRPQLETWVAYLSGTPAGYFELESQQDGAVEIAHIGLLPQFIGKGLGGYLVTQAVERAWAIGASRVRLNTCSLDHPAALSNYRARGFRIYREDTYTQELPDRPHGPWPGAERG